MKNLRKFLGIAVLLTVLSFTALGGDVDTPGRTDPPPSPPPGAPSSMTTSVFNEVLPILIGLTLRR